MFGERFEFDEQEHKLVDVKAVRRWMTWAKTQVRIGIELEKAGSVSGHGGFEGQRRRGEFERALQATRDYEILSEFNVVRLTHDGSVSGEGHEILVTGTIEDFATAHRKMVALHKLFETYRLRADSSCGMHYHLIAAQNSVEMPDIIVKNLYQLVRRYYPALLYMTGTTGSDGHVVRHTPESDRPTYFMSAAHMNISPLGRSMSAVKNSIVESVNRYCAFNMGDGEGDNKDLMFFDGNNVARFHVEFRFPDASDSPAQIVAQMFLFRALLMKAVELSQYGVVKVDSDHVKWSKTKEAVVALQGDDYRLNFDSTGMTFEQAVEFARTDAKNLLWSLRSHIINVDGESWNVLFSMVEKPVWTRRVGRRTWKAIEDALMPREAVLEGVAQNLLRLISLNQLTGIKNIANWKYAAGQALGVTQNELISAFRRLESQVKLDFDRQLGSFVAVW